MPLHLDRRSVTTEPTQFSSKHQCKYVGFPNWRCSYEQKDPDRLFSHSSLQFYGSNVDIGNKELPHRSSFFRPGINVGPECSPVIAKAVFPRRDSLAGRSTAGEVFL